MDGPIKIKAMTVAELINILVQVPNQDLRVFGDDCNFGGVEIKKVNYWSYGPDLGEEIVLLLSRGTNQKTKP